MYRTETGVYWAFYYYYYDRFQVLRRESVLQPAQRSLHLCVWLCLCAPQETEAIQGREHRRDHTAAKEAKEAKDAKDAKEAKDAKDAKEAKDATDAKDAKEAKEAKGTKGAKGAKASAKDHARESGSGVSSRSNVLYTPARLE